MAQAAHPHVLAHVPTKPTGISWASALGGHPIGIDPRTSSSVQVDLRFLNMRPNPLHLLTASR